jgi:acetolactate synthase I/II/III large subunit
MTCPFPTRTAAQRIVDTLVLNGVDHVFCVPGESYLAVLDALADVPDRIRVVTCRHEATAANMAEAYGKLTGRPGVCMVTRGPGATHAAVGVHTAQQDSTPMLLLVGQIAGAHRGRGAFQEVDYRQTFGTLAKWADELDRADRTAELLSRAFAVAQQGRQGPVVLALPEDQLHADGGPPAPAPVRPARSAVPADVLADIGTRLAVAERPLLLLGGSGWTQPALDAIAAWAERLALPVALSFRRKDLLVNDHPGYVGDLGFGISPRLVAHLRRADLLLAIGTRLGETPTQGYTLLTPGDSAERLIHLHPGPEEIGRAWPVALGAVAGNAEAALAVATLDPGRRWDAWRDPARADYLAFSAPIAVDGAVNLAELVAHLGQALPDDAIVCNGAGNFAAWLHRFHRHRRWHTQLAPTSGAMGYGFAAALAAKLVHPDRTVLCFAGDGDFLMASPDMATAVRYGLAVVTVVIDNGSYGTIRMHQEREFPRRVIGTDLTNPDFAAWARSFGAWGATVERTEEFPDALAQAVAVGGPAVIHVRTGVEQISPTRTITQLRAR